MRNYRRRQQRIQKRREQARKKYFFAAIILLTIVFFVIPYISGLLDKSGAASFSDDLPIITTDTGLKYQDVTVGEGAPVEAGQIVSVHYTGWLTNGFKFDSSLDTELPFQFALGTALVIRGWDEGIAGMRVGGVRILEIPSELAYGAQGQGDIPPGATLIFQVELLEIK